METTEITKWAEKHPPIISMFGVWAACSCVAASAYIELTKEKAIIFNIGETPPADNWLPFYNGPDRLRKKLIYFLKHLDEVSEFLGSSLEFIFENPTWPEILKPEIIKLTHNEELLLFNLSRDIFNEVQNDFFSETYKELEKPLDDDVVKLFEIPEIKFIYTVVLPSYIYYGISPFRLFRKARKGSLEDIDRILRIDPSAINDPFISQHFHAASKAAEKSDFQTMVHALQKPPKGVNSLQKIKFRIAGLISGIAMMLDYKLFATDIEMLFDAVAKDLGKPEFKLVETDDINNESIAKRIQRERTFWQSYLKLDK